METYTPEIEDAMRKFCKSLNEKDRRRYAGLEALKFGRGGQSHIARILGCSRNTVRKGATEVSGLSSPEVREKIGEPPGGKYRIRKPGGGCKPCRIKYPETDEQFLSVLRDHTAGDPTDEKVRRTNLREWEIAEAPERDCKVKVSRRIVRRLLRKHDYRVCPTFYTESRFQILPLRIIL